MKAAAEVDQLCINTIRFLSLDMVDRAKSGHPGTPMGAADFVYTLWDRFLKHNPKNPEWVDRDRFVLSPGHASALLYSLLHLTGYDLSMNELRRFRQWGSKTPGHPEYGLTPGVSATTGPLGQGFANGIGMALAENLLGESYNKPNHEIVDHFTYAVVSDGDMQEGVTSEAASLAGTLRLGKLVYLYDSNDVQIEGSTKMAFRENVARRFAAYGWHVIGPIRGDDVAAVDEAIREGQAETERPSLIICKTIIGHYSPIQGTSKAHSDPFDKEEIRETKDALGWPQEPSFYVPKEASSHLRKAISRGEEAEKEWNRRFEEYALEYPELARRFKAQMRGELSQGWDEGLESLFPAGTEPIATRDASGKILNTLVQRIPGLTGGSADLNPSTKSYLVGYGNFGFQEHYGRNIHFGVREHAMGAIAGGMSLHGGTLPYTATFLTFSDYMRPPMRLAAMMRIRVIYIFTHDSIGLGQDGPTHQPVEQLMGLRGVPNLTVIRPADATETTEAWRAAILDVRGPTALVFSRQKLPVMDRTRYSPAKGLRRGGYVLWQSKAGEPDVILIGTGSEVHVALEAGRTLADKDGYGVRVVSLPSWELFDAQPRKYRESILPSAVRARVAVEAGITVGWQHYVGLDGVAIGMNRFGASAPAEILYKKFGITAQRVAEAARGLVQRESGKG
ncbi:MAG: transketolase [Thaumarchaeota archaeon]|nr:transketolase [Nitrososphaerota archaeon]